MNFTERELREFLASDDTIVTPAYRIVNAAILNGHWSNGDYTIIYDKWSNRFTVTFTLRRSKK